MWNCPTTIFAEFWCIVDSKRWILEEIKWFGWVWSKILWYNASQDTVKMVVCCTINVVTTKTYVWMSLSRLSGLAMLLILQRFRIGPIVQMRRTLTIGRTQAQGSRLKSPPIPEQSLKLMRALWKSCKLWWKRNKLNLLHFSFIKIALFSLIWKCTFSRS